MPQLPPYTLTGATIFNDSAVSFQVTFSNPDDEASVQAFEWYLDGILVIDALTKNFSEQVDFGSHVIGARLLYNNAWSGTREFAFTALNIEIIGLDVLTSGESTSYIVIQHFPDGSTSNVTANYTFTANNDGGTFSANVFTATSDLTFHSLAVTITATITGGPPVTKDITVNAKKGILTVDIFNDAALNLVGIIDTIGSDSYAPAYTGSNFIPAGSVSAPADALILASDVVNQGNSLKWRFEFNLLRLKTLYPSTPSFTFFINGRSANAGDFTGAWSPKTEAATMTMQGEAGSYLPSETGDTVLDSGSIATTVGSGANGNYNIPLPTLLTFIYTPFDESITLNQGGPLD